VKVKIFEIRDRGTFIPALAIKLKSDDNPKEHYLLRRAGLDEDGSYTIALLKLQTGECELDRYEWNGAPTVRTMPEAHKYIEEHFDDLGTGAVIDVEFILGETKTPKLSEQFTCEF
jgi:hypothetical protein